MLLVLQTTLADLERDVNAMNDSSVTLKKSYVELTEWEQVLRKSETYFEGVRLIEMKKQ
jgi:hypothetical protein